MHVKQHLLEFYGIPWDAVSIRRHAPEDFLVRFSMHEHLDLVLGDPCPRGETLLFLWRHWLRTSMASPGPMRFRVLVGMKSVPTHLQDADTTQIILGSSCAKVFVAPPNAGDNDDPELFATAWCVHPDLIPDEKLVVVPEPEVHNTYGVLHLRPHEIIGTELSLLRYRRASESSSTKIGPRRPTP